MDEELRINIKDVMAEETVKSFSQGNIRAGDHVGEERCAI